MFRVREPTGRPTNKSYTHSTLQSSCSVVTQSCLTLWDPVAYSPPGSSVHGISQALILEWVVISFSQGSYWPRDWTHVSRTASGFFTTEALGKPESSENKIPTLFNKAIIFPFFFFLDKQTEYNWFLSLGTTSVLVQISLVGRAALCCGMFPSLPGRCSWMPVAAASKTSPNSAGWRDCKPLE